MGNGIQPKTVANRGRFSPEAPVGVTIISCRSCVSENSNKTDRAVAVNWHDRLSRRSLALGSCCNIDRRFLQCCEAYRNTTSLCVLTFADTSAAKDNVSVPICSLPRFQMNQIKPRRGVSCGPRSCGSAYCLSLGHLTQQMISSQAEGEGQLKSESYSRIPPRHITDSGWQSFKTQCHEYAHITSRRLGCTVLSSAFFFFFFCGGRLPRTSRWARTDEVYARRPVTKLGIRSARIRLTLRMAYSTPRLWLFGCSPNLYNRSEVSRVVSAHSFITHAVTEPRVRVPKCIVSAIAFTYNSVSWRCFRDMQRVMLRSQLTKQAQHTRVRRVQRYEKGSERGLRR